MRISEIDKKQSSALSKPLTPQKARLAALKKQKDNVSQALDAERKRQKIARAQQNLQQAQSAKL